MLSSEQIPGINIQPGFKKEIFISCKELHTLEKQRVSHLFQPDSELRNCEFVHQYFHIYLHSLLSQRSCATIAKPFELNTFNSFKNSNICRESTKLGITGHMWWQKKVGVTSYSNKEQH